MNAPAIEEAQRQLTDSVMSLPGVTGIGIGECQGAPCIVVFVVKRTDQLTAAIPSTYQGYTIRVDESGEFRARDEIEP